MKCADRTSITAAIPFELWQPIVESRLRQCATGGTTMHVPKTTVNEKRDPMSWQHDVGLARERCRMEPKSKSALVQLPSDAKLWSRVLAPNARHGVRALSLREVIRHLRPLPKRR
jgi:hypothetical protein